jgi:hypothetical protein
MRRTSWTDQDGLIGNSEEKCQKTEKNATDAGGRGGSVTNRS